MLKLRLMGDSGERGERDRILLLVDVGLVGGGVVGFVVSAAGWGDCVVVFASVFIDVSREIGVCSSSGDIVLGLVLEREDRRGRVTRLYRRDVDVVVFWGLGVGLRSGFGRGEELLEGRDEVEKVSHRRMVVVLVLVLVVVLVVGFSSPG